MKITLATPEANGRHHHYCKVMDSPDIEWLGTIQSPFSGPALDRIQGILISDEWYSPTRLIIAECKRRRIPVFHVADGILEWRNLFENPRSTVPENGSPLFQPVLADHIFCMGPFQKWQLEWLGNKTSIHATGLPRLDAVQTASCKPQSNPLPPRLLVATANTPWFDGAQRLRFISEFSRFVELCERETARPNPQFHCSWRVANAVAEALGLSADTGGSASDALASCAALITTPSTFAVEAMLMGVPTMLFDPFACPGFIPSAWHATSAETAFYQIPELLHPSEARCRLQDSMRGLLVPSDQKASQRVRECVLNVVKTGQAPKASVSEPMLASPVSPLHDFRLEGLPAHLSPADINGLLATLPALDSKIADQRAKIESLQRQLYTPNLRDGVRAMARALWNTFRPTA